MTKPRDKQRARRNAEWQEESARRVALARTTVGLESDAVLPDEVLVAEAEHFLPRSNPSGSMHHDIASHEQWAGYRFIGLGNTAADRERLASGLSRTYSINPNRSRAGGEASRRSAAGGRRRSLRPRT